MPFAGGIDESAGLRRGRGIEREIVQGQIVVRMFAQPSLDLRLSLQIIDGGLRRCAASDRCFRWIEQAGCRRGPYITLALQNESAIVHHAPYPLSWLPSPVVAVIAAVPIH